MKKILTFITIIGCLILITGCGNNKKELITRKHIEENDGRFCNEYAFLLKDYGELISYDVYKEKSYNEYEKLFGTSEGYLIGSIITTNNSIYFIETSVNTNGRFIRRIPLDGNLDNIESYSTEDMNIITEVYGIKDNYMYLKYKSGIGANSKDVYTKLNIKNGTFDVIQKDDIPSTFDYNVC